MEASFATPASESDAHVTAGSDGRLWVGRIMSGLPAWFLLFDAAMKLMKPPFVVQATVELGYPESVIVGLGITLWWCRSSGGKV